MRAGGWGEPCKVAEKLSRAANGRNVDLGGGEPYSGGRKTTRTQMRKRFSILHAAIVLALAATAGRPGLADEGAAHPLFSAEPPSPEALAFLRDAYLPALAANDIQQALALTDMRGFRQYLLDVRMREVKANMPDMTPEQERELSAFYQTNNLAPANLAAIVGDSLVQGRYTGLKWESASFAPAPEPLQGYAVQVGATDPSGRHQSVLVGIKQLGDQWAVAPEIPMDISFRVAAARKAGMADIPMPEPVAALATAFWNACKEGDPETAYSLFGPDYRSRIPLLGFLGIYQELVDRIGLPENWTPGPCRPLPGDRIGIGLDVSGAKGKTAAIMTFRKMGQTWVLDEAQFRPPSAANRSAAAQSRAHAAANAAAAPGGAPVVEAPAGADDPESAFPAFSGPEQPVGPE